MKILNGQYRKEEAMLFGPLRKYTHFYTHAHTLIGSIHLSVQDPHNGHPPPTRITKRTGEYFNSTFLLLSAHVVSRSLFHVPIPILFPVL